MGLIRACLQHKENQIMKKSGKNYRSQLGMAKSAAEQIILATLVGEWIREDYIPSKLNAVVQNAEDAIADAWRDDPTINFLQWQTSAREIFEEQNGCDAIRDSRETPRNIIFAEMASAMILPGKLILSRRA